MLSKQICEKCYAEAGWPWRPKGVEVRYWSKGVVYCPERYSMRMPDGTIEERGYITSNYCLVRKGPSKHCLFFLEQKLHHHANKKTLPKMPRSS